MKKTQILSAIALAFALGVVAPIAVAENASAAVVEGKTNQDYLDEQKAAVKAKFGPVEIYNGNGTTSIIADGYNYYAAAEGQIIAANGVVDTEKATAATTLKSAVVAALSGNNIANTDLSTANQTVLNGTDWTSGTADYAKVMAIAESIKANLASWNEGVVGTTKKAEADSAIAAINAAIDAAKASLDTAVDNAKATSAITDVMGTAAQLTNETIVAPTTVAELNAIIAKVENKLPQMAAYRRVAAEINKVTTVAGLTDRQVKQVVDNLWAAYNGTPITTPTDEIVNGKDDVNAPATGVVGTAEGTATTVSIVAGLATALTALGAGVVAYRSARRK